MPQRRQNRGQRPRRYKGPAGIFALDNTGERFREIDRWGRVRNVNAADALQRTEGGKLIKNPFRTGKWGWGREKKARQKYGKWGVKPGAGGGAGGDAGGGGGGAGTTTGPNPYIGPWIEGFSTEGTQWMPMVGGGYINTGTGQMWQGGAPTGSGGAGGDYEQQLVNFITGLLEGF